MDRNAKILIVGHDDVLEKSLRDSFQKRRFLAVQSSSQLGLNATIQPAVYDFFQRNKPEYVFLTSTRSGGIGVNLKNPAEFLYHNLESQNNIVYASWKFGVKKLLYYGASCVYPKNCPQPIKEEYLLTGELEETSEAYSIAKISGIKLCQAFKKQYGFNAITMVPATVYGPQSDTNLETAHVLGALLAKFSQAVRNNEQEVIVWGSGEARREFLFVDDFVAASVFLMETYDRNEIINAGFGEDISVKDLATLIASITGFRGKINFDRSKPDGTKQKLLDSARIKSLGFKPKVTLEEGIQKTFQSMKQSLEIR